MGTGPLDKTSTGAHGASTAHYVCEHNGCIWDDADRWATVLRHLHAAL
jgi:hypothetical protein